MTIRSLPCLRSAVSCAGYAPRYRPTLSTLAHSPSGFRAWWTLGKSRAAAFRSSATRGLSRTHHTPKVRRRHPRTFTKVPIGSRAISHPGAEAEQRPTAEFPTLQNPACRKNGVYMGLTISAPARNAPSHKNVSFPATLRIPERKPLRRPFPVVCSLLYGTTRPW